MSCWIVCLYIKIFRPSMFTMATHGMIITFYTKTVIQNLNFPESMDGKKNIKNLHYTQTVSGIMMLIPKSEALLLALQNSTLLCYISQCADCTNIGNIPRSKVKSRGRIYSIDFYADIELKFNNCHLTLSRRGGHLKIVSPTVTPTTKVVP